MRTSREHCQRGQAVCKLQRLGVIEESLDSVLQIVPALSVPSVCEPQRFLCPLMHLHIHEHSGIQQALMRCFER
jgi:hypothetical protein